MNTKKLRAIAEAATPGDWEWSGRTVEADGYVFMPQGSYLGDTLITLGDVYEGAAKDCDFIATFNPKLVTELLDERDELLAVLDHLAYRFEFFGKEDGVLKQARAAITKAKEGNE